tara:strand:+ start:316 stop:525 length:210 start_codon:yes stop_codon:yes gene_type:complete
MKIGDLVKWTEVEEVYHMFCAHPAMKNLTEHRKCGIVIDKNPVYFFVRWENGEMIAQKPNTIEVISDTR